MQTTVFQRLQSALASSNDEKFATTILDEIFASGLFKLFVPRSLGGLEMQFPQAVKLVEQISQLDGSLGWCVQIGAGGGFFVQYFSPKLCEETVRHREFVIAGSGTPSGGGVTTKNGLRVTGSWKYCSGSDYASVFTALTTSGKGSYTAVALLPDQVEVVRDWNSLGMRSTSSNTIRCLEAEVPEHRLFHVGKRIQDFDYGVYDLPFDTFAKTLIFSVALGVAHSWNRCLNRLLSSSASEPNPEYQKFENLLEEKQTNLNMITQRFYEILQSSWETFYLASDHQVHFSELHNTVASSTRQLFLDASELFFYSGMQTINNRESFPSRLWADLCTVVQHRMLKS